MLRPGESKTSKGSSSSTKRTVRQRTQYGGDVDKSVDQSPGDGYCNWIHRAKEMLLLRENTLLGIRVDKANSIINQGQFVCQIDKEIVKRCQRRIQNVIESWCGVNLEKKATDIPYRTFREYFNVAKNWWDQRKTNILGTTLWSKLLLYLKATLPDVEREPVLFNVLNGLFQAQVQYTNTKQQPLIPDGVIKNCKEIKYFFFSLCNDLDIDGWLKEDIQRDKRMDAAQNQRHKRTGNAKTIAKKLRSNLARLSREKQREKNGNSAINGMDGNHGMNGINPVTSTRNRNGNRTTTRNSRTTTTPRGLLGVYPSPDFIADQMHSPLALPPIHNIAMTPILSPVSPVSSPDFQDEQSVHTSSNAQSNGTLSNSNVNSGLICYDYTQAIMSLANEFMANNNQIPLQSTDCVGVSGSCTPGGTVTTLDGVEPMGYRTVYILMAQQVPVNGTPAFPGSQVSESIHSMNSINSLNSMNSVTSSVSPRSVTYNGIHHSNYSPSGNVPHPLRYILPMSPSRVFGAIWVKMMKWSESQR